MLEAMHVWVNLWGFSKDRLTHNLRYSRFSLTQLKQLERELWGELRFYRGDAAYLDSLDDILQEVKDEIRVRQNWEMVFCRA